MDNQTTHSTATLLFSFLLSFLGLSCASIVGGLVWQRVIARWRRHEGPPGTAGSIELWSTPRLWDVCIQGGLSAAKVSDCAWEQLRPLALRLSAAAASHSGVVVKPSPATWTSKWKRLSPFRRDRAAFQAKRNISDAVEDGLDLDGRHASIAVVIAYPFCPITTELGEFALGTAHMSCCEPCEGRNTPWISHT
ncbi:hypothetical protein C8Q77DRAFT_350092 [Trametes polyzona]|nr:hypothetical protein C8Q77DRAFT_350092 [Trametes polyzona]